jgi:hypothetical protein
MRIPYLIPDLQKKTRYLSQAVPQAQDAIREAPIPIADRDPKFPIFNDPDSLEMSCKIIFNQVMGPKRSGNRRRVESGILHSGYPGSIRSKSSFSTSERIRSLYVPPSVSEQVFPSGTASIENSHSLMGQTSVHLSSENPGASISPIIHTKFRATDRMIGLEVRFPHEGPFTAPRQAKMVKPRSVYSGKIKRNQAMLIWPRLRASNFFPNNIQATPAPWPART